MNYFRWANWAGTPDDKLPAEVRERAQAAALLVRQATQAPVNYATLAVALLLFCIGAGLAIFQPLTFFTFSGHDDDALRCAVRERALGLVPIRTVELSGLESATAEMRRESREETESSGRRPSMHTPVQTLSLKNADGQLHEWRMEYVLGANFPDVANG